MPHTPSFPASRRAFISAITAGSATLALGLSACTDNPNYPANPNEPASDNGGGEATTVQVTITDDDCVLDTDSVPAGVVTFMITNEGTVPNEFEILAEDQLRIITERENIGPGTSADITTALREGTYFSASKPNMVGALVGVKELTVTPGAGSDVDEDTAALQEEAVTNYTAYIRDQAGLLVTETENFVNVYLSGNVQEAMALYPQARRPYERIEPTAEAFGLEAPGDLDEAMDLRVQDLAADAGKEATDPAVLDEWTGWHRIEADLFSPNEAFHFPNDEVRKQVANQLLEDTRSLYDLVYGKVNSASGQFDITLEDVVQGASGLMNEVSFSKIVGEENTFSHTDLSDFHSNLEGASVAYGNVEHLVRDADSALADRIEAQFEDVRTELDQHRDGTTPDGGPAFVDYSTIAAVQEDAGEPPSDGDYTEAQRNLSQVVNALAESLSQVAGTILG